MKATNRLVRLAILQALACASGLLLTTPGRANADPAQFDIDAQPLPEALKSFAAQAKMQLLYRYDAVRSATANPVTGQLEKHAALEQMLRGTGLIAIYSGTDTATIRPVATEKKRADATSSDAPSAAPPSTSSAVPGSHSGYIRLAQAQTVPPREPQEPVETGETIQEVVVTGLRQSLVNSMTIKRDSLGIVDAISPEDIGKLPDTNLAESLQRITGVSIDRSGGEGAFVTVRGFGPEFNNVLLNGRQIATPTDPAQASGRAFSFDTLASELISGVEVFKSSVAQLQSGGVGSAINIRTARPFDYQGFKLSASGDINYEDNSDESSPDASFLISNRFADDRFGILLSGSYQRRKDRLNQAQTDGWIVNGGTPASQINGGAGVGITGSNPQGNLFVPQNFDTKVTFEDRKRIGGTLVLQYKPNDDLTITADTLYSRFTNTTDARSFGHWFTPSNLTNVVTDANGTAIDLTQGVGMASDFHDKAFDKKTRLSASGLNVEWRLSDRMTLNLDGSVSRAKEDPNGGAESELALLGYTGQTIRFQSDGSILPFTTGFVRPTDGPNAGVAGGTQPMFQHVMLYRGYGVDDKVAQLRADLEVAGDRSDEGLTSLRLGALFSRDEKDTALYSNDGGTGCTTCGYNNPAPANVPIGVFNAGGGFLSGISGANRLTTRWLTFDGQSLFNAITQQQQASTPGFTFAPPKVNDSLVEEDVYGGYLQAVFAGSLGGRSFSSVVGVRVENTQADISGLATNFVALTRLANDATQYGVSTAGTATVSKSNHYTDVLPNLSFKWALTDQITARFATSQTMTRPTLEQLSPVTTLVTLRPGNFAAASGTPDLQPFRSNNLDLSFEYYYGDANFISIGAYYKDVSNFIVLNQTTGAVNNSAGTPLLDPATGQPAQFTITAPTNGESAQVYGLEAGIQQSFGDSGFGIQLNGTLARSDKDLDPQDLANKFALTGLSNSANGVLFYDDKSNFEARMALNWRENFLQYLSPPPLNGAGQAVTQVRGRYQLDASATYHINKSLGVFLEGVNLTNRPVLKYAYYENQFLYAEDSGRRYKIGVRAQF
ncbi:TonB-dependent receptor [Peristeroidobacter soli]|uniref:TonB-dependent receptor n=1 Tax=Peristeroidobacter soli TaxID=2497877 RepID=UPI001C37589A|nr:TonB-dependent receptor [Peristeroidobacter soli]